MVVQADRDWGGQGGGGMNEEKEKQGDGKEGFWWIRDPKNYGIYLGVISAAFFIYRDFLSQKGFYPLDKPFWGDETFTVRLIAESWSAFWSDILRDVHPPLYFFLCKLFSPMNNGGVAHIRIFDSSGYTFFIILLAIASSWLFFKRTRERIRLLILNSIFILCSAHLFLFGPMMRYYLLTAFFVTASSLRLFLPDSPGYKISIRTKMVGYGLFLFLALATSYLSAIVIPAHIIYLYTKPREEAKPYFKSLIWVGVASIPLLILMFYQMRGLHGGEGISPGNLIPGFIARLFFTLYSFSIGEFIRPWDFWLSIPAFVSVAYLLFLAWRMRDTDFGKLSWIMLGVSLPLGIIVLTVINVGIEFSASRLTFLAPFFLMLLGLAPLYSNNKIEKIAGTTALVILIIVNCISSIHYINRTDYIQSTYIIPWAQIAEDAESNLTNDVGASIVLTDDDTLQYWLGDESNPIPAYNLLSIDDDPNLVNSDEITRVIVVYSPKIISDDDVRNLVRTMSGHEPVPVNEIDYLREDENSMRWKSMLLGRQVEEVKKKLIIYNVAGESSENQ
jgi:hypothetical protein